MCEYEFDCASEWQFEGGYDNESWGQLQIHYMIVSMSMAVSEYECECKVECKSDSQYKY